MGEVVSVYTGVCSQLYSSVWDTWLLYALLLWRPDMSMQARHGRAAFSSHGLLAMWPAPGHVSQSDIRSCNSIRTQSWASENMNPDDGSLLIILHQFGRVEHLMEEDPRVQI